MPGVAIEPTTLESWVQHPKHTRPRPLPERPVGVVYKIERVSKLLI